MEFTSIEIVGYVFIVIIAICTLTYRAWSKRANR